MFNDLSLHADGTRDDSGNVHRDDGHAGEAEELAAKIADRLAGLSVEQLRQLLDVIGDFGAAENPRERKEMSRVRAFCERFSEKDFSALGTTRRGFLSGARGVIKRGGSSKDIVG
jgi:hypothetical protein